MTIEELNSLDQDRFVEAVGWVFEHSPWVAARAWAQRPFAGIDVLHQAMVEQVEAARLDEQVALLRAHPDLGTRANISAASTAEQTAAGLNGLSPEEFERLHRLNEAYRDQFGFPFLLAVKGSTKYDVLQALEQRLQASPEDERREALRQVHRIARFRLEDTIK